MSQVKILLDENGIPKQWYNVAADMPNPPAPPLGPDGTPIGPDALAAIFPMALIEQKPFRRSMMQAWSAEVLASPIRG